MPNDLQLSDQDEVLLESLVLAASDNVARAPASDRDQYAPERRRAFVETSGAGNVYLGTGSAWVDVSENTGLLSKLFSGGDGNFDSVSTGDATITDGELSSAPSGTLWQRRTGNGSVITDKRSSISVTADNSEQELIELPTGGGGGGSPNGEILVLGRSVPGGPLFLDKVHVVGFNLSVVDSSTAGSPGGRTYTTPNDTLAVAIDGGGGDRIIAVVLTGISI